MEREMSKKKDKEMEKYFLNFIKLVVSLLLTLVILNFICLFYRYNGVRIKNEDGSTDYKWFSNQLYTHMEEGFSLNIFDKYGFNNYNVENKNIDILLLGSSNMEGSFVSRTENVGYLLNKHLKNLKTYNIGIGSHDFIICLKNLNKAYNAYKPQKYILIETMKLELDENILKNYLSNSISLLRSSKKDSIEFYLQKYNPFAKWSYIQLSQWLNISKKNIRNAIKTQVNDENLFMKEEYCSLLNQVLTSARKDIPTSIKIIVFYHSTTKIDNAGNFIKSSSVLVNKFKNVCEENGYIFVDVSNDMKDFYNKNHILCRGFINSKVGYGHLNKYGHEVIAKRLIKVINDLDCD